MIFFPNSHKAEGSLRFLEQAEALGHFVSIVTSMYIADIFLRVISWLIDTSSFLILGFKDAFLHKMGNVY